MTWSIVACDESSGQFGIAVATRFFAVGALVPHVAHVGAIATQALINPFFGTKGLDLLRADKSTAEAVEILVAADPGRDHRQLHGMDAQGRIAASRTLFTQIPDAGAGAECGETRQRALASGSGAGAAGPQGRSDRGISGGAQDGPEFAGQTGFEEDQVGCFLHGRRPRLSAPTSQADAPE